MHDSAYKQVEDLCIRYVRQEDCTLSRRVVLGSYYDIMGYYRRIYAEAGFPFLTRGRENWKTESAGGNLSGKKMRASEQREIGLAQQNRRHNGIIRE